MSEAEDRRLMKDAASEIRDLRRRNEILEAKVEMIDLFALVLHTKPAMRSQGACVDVAWQLEKRAAELDQQGP